ncbi:MAG TPA: hypothetical protein VJK02_17340 [Anaerolineales bacterium]|nr:hypothetical protein [Anaerolineales bacterium]
MKQITLGLIAFWIIAACTITPVTPTVVPEPTSTAPPTATLAPTETATPAPTATPLAYRNLTSQFAWFVEPDQRVPASGGTLLAKGTVNGSQAIVTITGAVLNAVDIAEGGWFLIPSPAFRPKFPQAVETGAALIGRGYRQRGLTGGICYWERYPLEDGPFVFRVKWTDQSNQNGRLDKNFPFNFEAGDFFSCTIAYEVVGP